MGRCHGAACSTPSRSRKCVKVASCDIERSPSPCSSPTFASSGNRTVGFDTRAASTIIGREKKNTAWANCTCVSTKSSRAIVPSRRAVK
jgi:hypothetical protein